MGDPNLCLEVHSLHASYGTTWALRNISLSIPQGLLVGITGPNGAGKSTFIKALCNLVPVQSNKILFFGNPYPVFRKKIAYIPQRSSICWDFPITVIEVVLMGAYPRLNFFKIPKREHKEQARQLLHQVGLSGLEHEAIGDLSGGQQQRVFVARALMQQAEVFLFDEPFTGIDAASEKKMLKIFQELKSQGKTLFIVHHDIQSWEVYFDWLILLNKELIAYGPTSQVLTSANMEKAYGCGLEQLFKHR